MFFPSIRILVLLIMNEVNYPFRLSFLLSGPCMDKTI